MLNKLISYTNKKFSILFSMLLLQKEKNIKNNLFTIQFINRKCSI